jgi:hypothetical protein
MASIPLFMPSLGAALRAVAAGMLALALAGCATAPPLPRPPAGQALAPGPDGPLADAERAFAMRHGDAQSGFKVLQANHDALAWRLAVIDSARHSLDLQYYVWFGDKVGQLLLARVVAAADRGVKVRLLFDDLNTLLHDMGSVELRDAALAQVDRHPRIEIRVFNAWRERDPARPRRGSGVGLRAPEPAHAQQADGGRQPRGRHRRPQHRRRVLRAQPTVQLPRPRRAGRRPGGAPGQRGVRPLLEQRLGAAHPARDIRRCA